MKNLNSFLYHSENKFLKTFLFFLETIFLGKKYHKYFMVRSLNHCIIVVFLSILIIVDFKLKCFQFKYTLVLVLVLIIQQYNHVLYILFLLYGLENFRISIVQVWLTTIIKLFSAKYQPILFTKSKDKILMKRDEYFF